MKGTVMNLKELLDVMYLNHVSGKDISDALEANDFTDLDSDGLREDLVELLSDVGYAISDPHDDSGIGAALSQAIVSLDDRDGMKNLVRVFAQEVASSEFGDIASILDYDKAVPRLAENLGLVSLRFGKEDVWAEIR